MRRMVMVTRGRKRRPITRSDGRNVGRRRGRSKVWIGSRRAPARPAPFFWL